MAFANLYNKFIKNESIVPKTKLIPRKVYKINSYEYVDGKLVNYSGNKSAIVFLIGITPDRMLHCLKISEVQPIKFFNWLKLHIKKDLDYDAIKNLVDKNAFNELLLADNRLGAKTFQKAKNNVIYQQQPGTYRTYFVKSIKSIKEVYFNPDEFMKVLRVPKPPQQSSSNENI